MGSRGLRVFPALQALLLLLSGAAAIEAPCSACLAVASELQRRLDAEKPRNHLDLRHRLDKEGKRYGKVIEYKLSELRAVELLDELCDDAAADYALVTLAGDAAGAGEGEGEEAAGEGARAWVRVKGKGSVIQKLGVSDEETAQRRELETFCGALLDRHEEGLVAALRGDEFGTEAGVAPVLCERIARRCGEGGAAEAEARLAAAIEARGAAAAKAGTVEVDLTGFGGGGGGGGEGSSVGSGSGGAEGGAGLSSDEAPIDEL
ncbi:hypothetical protein Rsub_06135 [Raphidocelis subcapitata]|uniref:DUF3456 domain-containing protein n=1 Tax=Raphidocelis subcapitata TaxID=307507 RepID=A0A2V0P7F2_9CHLO|nr:hypothetical protein Rsub_06135 [Raphidocelis subcapitata]|eukprot:GBF93803.1 hypothetical protein Rsub_06135 [Raphidocelis subcapitata]